MHALGFARLFSALTASAWAPSLCPTSNRDRALTMDWKGIFEEALELLAFEVRRSLSRVNSWALPLMLLPLLPLGFYAHDFMIAMSSVACFLIGGLIWLRLSLQRRESPGQPMILSLETVVAAVVYYGAGWLAGIIVAKVA